MAVDSRAKGARAETVVKETLIKHTGLNWQRTPLSGALDEKHGLKGDCYVPNEKNLFCVEIKHYKDDHLTSSILTSKSPQFLDWWSQTVREAGQVNRKPLLIYKFDRSKTFVAFTEEPSALYNYIQLCINDNIIYTTLLDTWLVEERPKFIL